MTTGEPWESMYEGLKKSTGKSNNWYGPVANVGDIHWLTASQVEMKLRLGIKGAVGSLFNQDFSAYSTTSVSFPPARQLNLQPAQAELLWLKLKLSHPEGYMEYLVDKTESGKTNVLVTAWGGIYQESLCLIRFVQHENKLIQIFYAVEGKDNIEVTQDPFIGYLMSLLP